MADDPIPAMVDIFVAHPERLNQLGAQVGDVAQAAARMAEFAALAKLTHPRQN